MPTLWDEVSQFVFLQPEWPAVFEAASRAKAAVHPDPRTACFYARRALELAVAWVYKSDASLRLPYQDNLSALIHEPTFKAAAGEAVFSKARVINTLGNQAVHSHRPIQQFDALTAVRELFHVSYWLARTYVRGAKPAPGLAFDANALPRTAPIPKQTIEQLQVDAEVRYGLTREILTSALAMVTGGSVPPDGSVRIGGAALDERDIRRGLERACRELARYAPTRADKIALIDKANEYRPLTLT